MFIDIYIKACVQVLIYNFINHDHIKHMTITIIKFVHLFLKNWFDQTTAFKAIKSKEILNGIKKYRD